MKPRVINTLDPTENEPLTIYREARLERKDRVPQGEGTIRSLCWTALHITLPEKSPKKKALPQ
jgi:hypothetical protein